MELKVSIARIRLTESHFSINHQYKMEKDKPIVLENNVGIQFKQSEKSLYLLLSVSSDAGKQPFRFSVTYEGVFAFENIPPKDELGRIANINCAAILFPYVRETIADLTRRAGLQPLHLPPFNFVAMYNENQKKTSPPTPRNPRKKAEKSV
jgi:preprotein translocase subunit SecB